MVQTNSVEETYMICKNAGKVSSITEIIFAISNIYCILNKHLLLCTKKLVANNYLRYKDGENADEYFIQWAMENSNRS